MKASKIEVPVNITGLDEAIEKMNRLSELLTEANQIISSIKEINIEIKVGSEL